MKHITLCFTAILLTTTLSAQDFSEAQPAGGNPQLNSFIDQELVYPEDSYNSKVEGTVSFLMDVDETGHVTGIREIACPDSSTFKEALRIFRMVEWTPAYKGGFKVKSSRLFKIDFNINKYNRLCKLRGYRSIINPFEPVDSSLKIYWYRNLDSAPRPIFADSKETLSGFIAKNLQYPEPAIRQNVAGVVKLTFIVETNGRVSNIEVANSVGAGCNEEAIRLLRLMKWMPGIVDNNAVRTRTSFSISFSLDRGKEGIFNPVIKSSYGG